MKILKRFDSIVRQQKGYELCGKITSKHLADMIGERVSVIIVEFKGGKNAK